ncbi:MAG: hypothetical protein QOJ65_989, partial [Fimbriimonadaceae bacterium]|nr:hypothetical protein [Fimbriimonadaceae bacterium]
PSHTAKITELFGIFRLLVDTARPNNSMVVNSGDFEVILMPRSADDDNVQILLVALNGSKATEMYWGDARLSSGTFVAYPLAALTTGSASGAIQGTLSGFLDAAAAPVTIAAPSDAARVRYGRYNISSILPPGFKRSGRLIVFRR